MAGHKVARGDLLQRGLGLLALVAGPGAAAGKLQPLGVLMGLGTSPEIMMRFFWASSAGSGMGTAESSAWE